MTPKTFYFFEKIMLNVFYIYLIFIIMFMKGAKTALEEIVSRQEKEIETLMENGMEMHKLLSETISEEERSQMLLANIAELKESLTERLDEIMSLTDQLDHKNQEV